MADNTDEAEQDRSVTRESQWRTQQLSLIYMQNSINFLFSCI